MNTLSAKTIKEITEFIFVYDGPAVADAIFVVGGSLPQVAELAARLYKKGYSDKIKDTVLRERICKQLILF